MQNHPVDEINASKTYRYKIDFVLDDVVPIVKRTYGGNIAGIEQKYRRQENKGKVWRDEGKKSKGESMKTKSNHNDGNLCG